MYRGRPFEPRFSELSKGEMTQEIAKMIWDYDPITGIVRWKVSPRERVYPGNVAGVVGVHGYRILCFKRKKYKVSRIAWLIMTGSWPIEEVDHIDCNRSNDIWKNLRLANSGQNKCNMRTRKDNALGIKGVCLDKRTGLFHAYICRKGRRKNLGGYATPQEAKLVYDSAAENWHKEFARAS